MTDIEKSIGYEFKDKSLLERALTHSSYANENNCKDNERLEFLGDSVLGLIVGESLFSKLPESHEGSLTKLRASLVCESSLFELACKIGLQNEIKFGNCEKSEGRKRPSVVSDAFEALLAALYLDAGMDFVKPWLLKLMQSAIDDAMSGKRDKDFKTMLQEYIQSKHCGMVEYKVVAESGPDHAKFFEIEVVLNGEVIGKAGGSSKKKAEQLAAQQALKKYEVL